MYTVFSFDWLFLYVLCIENLFSTKPLIIWNNADLLLTGPLRTNFSEIWIKLQKFPLKILNVKMLSANGGHFISVSHYDVPVASLKTCITCCCSVLYSSSGRASSRSTLNISSSETFWNVSGAENSTKQKHSLKNNWENHKKTHQITWHYSLLRKDIFLVNYDI